MLDQAQILRQVSHILYSTYFTFLLSGHKPIGVFLTSADEMYGPITILRRDGHLVKKIPWTAFKLSDHDWHRVIDARDILGVRVPCPLFG